jgi:hypothetical protein
MKGEPGHTFPEAYGRMGPNEVYQKPMKWESWTSSASAKTWKPTGP